jgi:hypothetical protein
LPSLNMSAANACSDKAHKNSMEQRIFFME